MELDLYADLDIDRPAVFESWLETPLFDRFK
jgi:hypothetical protein